VTVDYAIELADACNLRCPSCPQGRTPHPGGAAALMDLDLLERILDCIRTGPPVSEIALCNWGEPFMHPELATAVGLVDRIGARCHISTNLNAMKDIDEVLSAGLDSLRISVSGYVQETYVRTHQGGDIEIVKRNMRELREAIERTRSRVRVHVYFHRYRANLDDELSMRELARGLGFGFHPVWALLLSVDRVLALVEGRGGSGATALDDEEQRLLDALALPLFPALRAARRLSHLPCPFQDSIAPIDIQGRARLCCARYDDGESAIGPFLEMPLERIAALRRSHPLCERCMAQGVHVYQSLGTAEFDRLAVERIGPEYASRGYLRWERLKKRALNALPDRLKRPLLELYRRVGERG